MSYVKNHPQKMFDIEDEVLEEPSCSETGSILELLEQHSMGNRRSLSVSRKTEFESRKLDEQVKEWADLKKYVVTKKKGNWAPFISASCVAQQPEIRDIFGTMLSGSTSKRLLITPAPSVERN